jgi:hypothetical protein
MVCLKSWVLGTQLGHQAKFGGQECMLRNPLEHAAARHSVTSPAHSHDAWAFNLQADSRHVTHGGVINCLVEGACLTWALLRYDCRAESGTRCSSPTLEPPSPLLCLVAGMTQSQPLRSPCRSGLIREGSASASAQCRTASNKYST